MSDGTVGKDWKGKLAEFVFGQEANTAILMFILAFVGFIYYQDQTIWRPASIEQIKDGFLENTAQHKEIVTDLKESFLKDSEEQRRTFSETVDRVERLATGRPTLKIESKTTSLP